MLCWTEPGTERTVQFAHAVIRNRAKHGAVGIVAVAGERQYPSINAVSWHALAPFQ